MATSIPVTNRQTESLFVQIQENFSKYIVTPANAFGLGGFVFDVEGDTTITLNADITDHYTEDNSPIQDHIGIRPLRVTLNSYVGELVYRLDNTTDTPLQKVVQKLTIINQYLPILSRAAEQIKPQLALASNILTAKEVSRIDALKGLQPPTLNNIVDLWALTKNLNPSASRQQKAYMYFKALLEQKILVSVQTPFEFLSNMAIESITATQPEGSRYISDFSITLKKIRVAEVKAGNFDPLKYQERAQQQAQNESKNGKIQGLSFDVSPIISGLRLGGVLQ